MALTKLTTDLIDGDLGGGTTWVSDSKTANFTAVAGKGYFVNTTSAAVTVTLPSSPTAGDEVSIVDYAGTADTNNITITSSDNINGSSDDVKINYERGGVSMVYVDATQGWIAYNANNETATALPLDTPPLTVDYLVVAGGGGGGGAGGAGAGGLLTTYATSPSTSSGNQSQLNLTTSDTYTITVGGGGAGSGGTYAPVGSKGDNSSITGTTITDIIATGGGAGGGSSSTSSDMNGGSGGGAGWSTTPGTGISGQGYAGSYGQANPYSIGGGGGGASETPANANGTTNTPGPGGEGVDVSITGISVDYAGGGGGCGFSTSSGVGAAPIKGGGGAGFNWNGNTASNPTPNTGTDGKGGGGGSGGNGGSGVVILRYPNTYTATIGAGLTGSTATDGSDKVTTFTAGTGIISFS